MYIVLRNFCVYFRVGGKQNIAGESLLRLIGKYQRFCLALTAEQYPRESRYTPCALIKTLNVL